METHARSRTPGLTVTEIMDAAHAGVIRGMYIMGENPAMSDPNVEHAREAMAELEHLVVQDIFFTETASYADVVLPASAFPEKTGTFTNTDRRVQLGRKAIEPPGEARQDLWIIEEIARRMGLDWNYASPADVFAEIAHAHAEHGGHHLGAARARGLVHVSARARRRSGRTGHLHRRLPARRRPRPVRARPTYTHADEMPDAEYPFMFTTGRQLEHWHTGSMTRRASVLDALEPDPVVSVHPDDLAALGVEPGERDHAGIAARHAHARTRAPTAACSAARSSCRSPTTRRRRTCSPTTRSIRSARSRSSSSARSGCAAAGASPPRCC